MKLFHVAFAFTEGFLQFFEALLDSFWHKFIFTLICDEVIEEFD